MRKALELKPSLKLGLAGPSHVLSDEAVLSVADELEAALVTVDGEPSSGEENASTYGSVPDLIYESHLRLSGGSAKEILDRALARATAETNKQKKGVLLEVLSAVMLSQVRGYEVAHVGISNRTQQMDVLVHNRNTSGILRTGEVVLVEAKNWALPVGTLEYSSLVRKIQARHGRCRLGFFITTGRFTRGVELEKLRDSMGELMVVTLDQNSLPAVWRTGKSIEANIELAAIAATVA